MEKGVFQLDRQKSNQSEKKVHMVSGESDQPQHPMSEEEDLSAGQCWAPEEDLKSLIINISKNLANFLIY